MPSDSDSEEDTVMHESLSDSQIATFRSFAPELLQRIFLFAVIDFESEDEEWEPVDRHEFRNRVVSLCLVCRTWRDVAVRFCALWTETPPLVVGFGEEDDSDSENSDDEEDQEEDGSGWKQLLVEEMVRFKIFAARAGALPLTVDWTCDAVEPSQWAERKKEATESLSLLTAYCHRWGDASLDGIHALGLECLSPIRGKIPLLKELKLEINGAPGPQADGAFIPHTVDCFADAPALRSVDVTYYSNLISVALPFSQLEDIAITWNEKVATVYLELLQSESPNLRSFMAYQPTKDADIAVPSSPCTLPNLARLDFSALEDVDESFASHLQMLTLPALTSVTLDGEMPDSLITKLLGLIRRSGCSLQELELGSPLPVSRTSPISETVFEILSLCPRLKRLTMGHTDVEALRRLVLDRSAPHPMLPCLEYLDVERDFDETDSEDGQGAPIGDEIDLRALFEMLESRRVRVDPSDSGRDEGGLKALGLRGYDAPSLRQALAKWEREVYGHLLIDSPALDTVDDDLMKLIEDAYSKSVLYYSGADPLDDDDPKSWRALVTPEMLELIEKLEKVDFENINASFLVRLDYPLHMTQARNRANPWPICPETEALRALDGRLGALLEKWKPFIIRDTLCLPYRWGHWRTDVNIKWLPFDDEKVYWDWLTTGQENEG